MLHEKKKQNVKEQLICAYINVAFLQSLIDLILTKHQFHLFKV